MATREEVRKRLEEDKIEFLLTQFVDIYGSAKVKMVPVSCFDDVVDTGAGFAGAAVWGLGQGPHSHDMLARIDLDTYTRLPWKPNTARFASDLYVDDEPYMFCSRLNLKRVVSQARAKGYAFNVGIEPEHFLVTRKDDGTIAPWDPDGVDNLRKPCYDFKGMSPTMDYLQDITNFCNALGWGVYQTDHEDANGQYEVNFAYADALTTADRHVFFKMMASQVAKKYGAVATFMPKPFFDRTGSGAHIHYHLADAETGQNVFLDPKDPRGLGLSKAGYNFIGGILHHAPALCCITSPTVNCYKRLQIGAALYSSRSGFLWTPAFATYGDNNRTQMIRTAGPGHFEDRTISAGTNAYLTFAAYLTAGLDGIEKEMDPGDPNLGNMYELGLEEIQRHGIRMLPQSLREALYALEADEVVQSSLGVIHDEFVHLKLREWKEYHHQVTRWEVGQYLTMF